MVFIILLRYALLPGNKLKELMIQNNMDFSNVELALKKTQRKTIGHRKEGKWVTKFYLMNHLSWTKTKPQMTA